MKGGRSHRQPNQRIVRAEQIVEAAPAVAAADLHLGHSSLVRQRRERRAYDRPSSRRGLGRLLYERRLNLRSAEVLLPFAGPEYRHGRHSGLIVQDAMSSNSRYSKV